MAAPHYYPPPSHNPYFGHAVPQYVQPQPQYVQYPAPRPMYMQPQSCNVTNNINAGGKQVQYLAYNLDNKYLHNIFFSFSFIFRILTVTTNLIIEVVAAVLISAIHIVTE